MAMDFSEALQLVGPFIAIAGFISGVWYKVEGKIDKVQTKAEAAEKALSEFKLKVVEEYASWDTVRSIETRLTERMDSLSDAVMKMPDAIVDRMVNMIKLTSK